MKNMTTIAALMALFAANAKAQTVLTGGFGTSGMGIVNGNTYTKTGTLGSGALPFVSASNDGTKFFVSAIWDSMLYFIDVPTMSFTDSMSIFVRNLASSNETSTLFTINDRCLIRINTATKSVTDSIFLGAPWLLEERPNAKEVWVSDSGKVHIVDYTSGLTKATITLAPSPYDYGGVRFTPGGTIAYKGTGTSKKIFKINAVTKAVMDSVSTPNYGAGALVVSHDSSKLFVCDATNSYLKVYNASTMALIDSINCGTRAPMNVYRHPSRPEIWAVHHFRDSVSVYNENTHALIAAFNISSSPWYLAFSTGTTAVNDINTSNADIFMFPNPASNTVVVALPDSKSRQIVLSDNFGRMISTYTSKNVYESIDIANLAAGSYHFTVIDEGKVLKTLKWVKY